MDQYEITYVHEYRAYGRTVEAPSFEEAEAMCGEGEFVSGLIIQDEVCDDLLAENMRLRVGEALREVANG